MIGGVDLHGRPDLGAGADADFDDVQDDAVEVHEDAVAETDVGAEVTKERRADDGIRADMGESLAQQRMPLRYGLCQRRVVAHQPCLGHRLVGRDFVVGTIQFPGQHFLLFGLAQPTTPSLGNASGAAASAARAMALSSSIRVTSASTESNFNSSRMKAMKATSSDAP